jgi:uncharacterized iron-regulated protein
MRAARLAAGGAHRVSVLLRATLASSDGVGDGSGVGPWPPRLLAIGLVGLVASCAVPRPPAPARTSGSTGCVRPAQWVVPATHRERAASEVMASAARSRIVLLGELHDRADHHRWQLQTVAALAARRPVVLGFEMFPRRTQGVLDRWVAGELDDGALLRESDWPRVWGFRASLYLPLFEFARLNRVPMRGLNVDRALVSRVGRDGWAAVPAAEREGISDPAPPVHAYRAMLAEAMAAHGPEAAGSDASLQRFVEAQLTWDRALAEGLVEATRANPRALVVGIMGTGHLEHGYGVPHQLAALGEHDVTVLLPWDTDRDCAQLTPDLADAVFGVAPAVETADHGPHLGVVLAPARDGVRVAGVTPGSVASAAGLRRDDVIVEAAGMRTPTLADLRAIVDAQAPGTWLPLRVRHGRRTREIVARFPRPS